MSSKWPRIAGALVAVVLSLCLVNLDAQPAAAWGISPGPVAIGETLTAGAATSETAVAGGVCVASVVCAGTVAAVGMIAYATHDTWMPWVRGIFSGGASGADRDAGSKACTVTATSPQVSGNTLTFTWIQTSSCQNDSPAIGAATGSAGSYTCQNGDAVVTTVLSSGAFGGYLGGGSGLSSEVTSKTYTIPVCSVGQTLVAFSGILHDYWWHGNGTASLVYSAPVPSDQVSVKTDVTCRKPDGSTVTISGTMTGDTGKVPMPSCAEEVGTGATPTKVVINSGLPGAETPSESVDLGTLQNDYPGCFDASGAFTGSCRVRVWVNGNPCHVGDAGCVSWETGAEDNGDQVECRLGSYVIPLDTCRPLRHAYETSTGTQYVTGVDSGTGTVTLTPTETQPSTAPSPSAGPSVGTLPTTGTNPSVGPEPPTTTAPTPQESGSESCWGSGWSWNPVSWVYVPVRCALQWAFVPQPGFLDSSVTSLKTAVGNTIVGTYLAPLSGLFSIPSASNCSGIHVHYDLGLTGHTQPVDEQIAAACSGDKLATAAGIVKTVLSAMLVIGGAWGCIRLVVNAFFPGLVKPLSMSSDTGMTADGSAPDAYNAQGSERDW